MSITVNSVNDEPWLEEEEIFYSLDKNASLNMHVLDKAQDVEDDPLEITIASAPLHGSATVSDNGTALDFSDDYIVYTPSSGFTGVDSFRYTLDDGNGGLATGTVFVTVYEEGQWANSIVTATSAYAASGDWSAEQMLGEPDTFYYGDQGTAWAAAEADQGLQTVTLGFASLATATGVVIRESNGNGFVRKVELEDTYSGWQTVWQEFDSSLPGKPTDLVITFPGTYLTQKVRITIDTDHALGAWEEIDAVQLAQDEVAQGIGREPLGDDRVGHAALDVLVDAEVEGGEQAGSAAGHRDSRADSRAGTGCRRPCSAGKGRP